MSNSKEERSEGIYDDTAISEYASIGVTDAVYEDLQKPREDKFQGSQNVSNAPEKRNPCRTVAVGLGLLTLLLLAGITGLGIHYFHEQATAAEEAKHKNYNLTQTISQSEEEVAQLQAVNSNITAQRDELQERLDERKCCPGWQKFGNHCYYFSISTKTWEESKKDCENRDAYLVIITSAEEQEFISGLRVGAWIGLVWQEDGELWKWVDGSPLTTAYWAPNEPNNLKNVQEDCGETLQPDFLWNDEPCGRSQRWICKKEI